MIPNLLTVEKTAEILGVSISFVYKLVRGKQLTAVKIGTAVRIRQNDIDEFVTKNLTVVEMKKLPEVPPTQQHDWSNRPINLK
jgi:excisionase family DNA binding protein